MSATGYLNCLGCRNREAEIARLRRIRDDGEPVLAAECDEARAVPVEGAVGACVLNGCQNAEWSGVAHDALASRDRLIAQCRINDEREIAYVQTIERLRDERDEALAERDRLQREVERRGRIIADALNALRMQGATNWERVQAAGFILAALSTPPREALKGEAGRPQS